MKTTNISEICRCCMGTGSIEIFDTVFEFSSLASIIEICTHTSLSIVDNLPKKICQHCFDKLTICYQFITKYLEVQNSIANLSKKIIEINIKENIEPSYCNVVNIKEEVVLSAKVEPKTNSYSSDDDVPLSRLKESNGILLEKHGFHDAKFGACNVMENLQHTKFPSSKNESSSVKIFYTKQKHDKISSYGHKKFKQNYFCLKCNESFNFIKLLEQHCRSTGHPIPRRHHCETCSLKFLTKSCLKAHLRTHSNEKPHTCEDCGMKFSLRSNLQRHKRRHTGEKAFFCEICGRGFIQKHTLTIHMRLHNGETPYICQECGKGYRAKPLLTQHLKKHNGLETYYREHYLKHGSLKVECTICKKLLTKSGMYTHMKVQHGDGLKKFLCNLCGKTYTSKRSLETHMNVHTKKIIYRCDICTKSFSHYNYLKTHMRIHFGEKPHCCEICGRTFTQRAHLDGHMRTHTGARPYTCTYCNKSFAMNGNLKVHMRIHTGETPHKCSICNKGFVDSSNKKKHESTVHQLNHNIVQ